MEEEINKLKKMWETNCQKFKKNGVLIEDPTTTYIFDNVEIGVGTVIHPNCTIKDDNIIGEDCEIGPNSFIREHCRLANNVKVGNCCEIKKVTIGEGSKVPHLSYMGDNQRRRKPYFNTVRS